MHGITNKNGTKETVTTKTVTVYEPSANKDPFDEYPELKEIKEFSSLTANEYKFVYYFANRNSELVSKQPRTQKISMCFDKAFGSTMTGVEKARYLDMDFPERITEAIARMRMINPDVRHRAKRMVEKIFNSYESILELSSTSTENVAKAKDYVELARNISKALPELVEQMEHPFGVREKQAGSDAKHDEDTSILDQVMKNSK